MGSTSFSTTTTQVPPPDIIFETPIPEEVFANGGVPDDSGWYLIGGITVMSLMTIVILALTRLRPIQVLPPPPIVAAFDSVIDVFGDHRETAGGGWSSLFDQPAYDSNVWLDSMGEEDSESEA